MAAQGDMLTAFFAPSGTVQKFSPVIIKGEKAFWGFL
jgi:hypothetical protein